MRILITEDTVASGRCVEKGQEVDVSEKDAHLLVRLKKAVLVHQKGTLPKETSMNDEPKPKTMTTQNSGLVGDIEETEHEHGETTEPQADTKTPKRETNAPKYETKVEKPETAVKKGKTSELKPEQKSKGKGKPASRR